MISDLKKIFDCNPVNPQPGCLSPIQRLPGAQNFQNLGDFLSGFLNIVLFIAAFVAFYWLIWGAWAYLFAQGEKENLAKARLRIRWALIGLMIIFMAYFIAKFAGEIFPSKGGLPF